MTPPEDRRNTLLEANDVAEMLARVERNIKDTLDRIERDLKDRLTRHETEDKDIHTGDRTASDRLEVRIRALEDTRTKGSGAWWVLAAILGVVVSITSVVVASTAMDEIRAARQQLWAPPPIVGRKP